MEQWARSLGPPNYFEGFFSPGVNAVAGVGTKRVTLAALWDRERPPRWQYAELFDDGAGFACRLLPDARTDSTQARTGTWVLNEALVWELGRCLHLLGRHAVENAGAWGDAVVEARLVGRAMKLAYRQLVMQGGAAFGWTHEVPQGRELDEAASRHTIVVEAASRIGPDFTGAARLIATDLFHAFGSPEVRQIDAAGALRARHLGGNGELRAWAERQSITVTDEAVIGE
jgi:hypothetical protein